MKKSEILLSVWDHDIILATYASLSLLHLEDISEVVFLLFESDLTLPDYRMEEDLYHAIDYAKKSGKNLMIQTYLPDHPLLDTIVEGNYRDFLTLMSEERKKFHYPPYTDFVTIRIHDESKDKLHDMVKKLVNKIDTVKSDDIFVAYDREAMERTRWEWVEKIILKGKDIKPFLDMLEVELVRNRSITLERN
jgi:primosomal protein N' (replication factor Y) (superfamily II helicase)